MWEDKEVIWDCKAWSWVLEMDEAAGDVFDASGLGVEGGVVPPPWVVVAGVDAEGLLLLAGTVVGVVEGWMVVEEPPLPEVYDEPPEPEGTTY